MIMQVLARSLHNAWEGKPHTAEGGIMDPLTLGLLIVMVAVILMGWVIGHFGSSRRMHV
jgi:hypothetical protein